MILQTQCTSFKAELYQGIHDLTTDTLKLALYTASANLSADTTVYTATGEVTGTGYSAGGVVVTGVTVQTGSGTAFVSFDNVSYAPAGFTSRGALLYNVTQGNKAIAVLDFGSDKTTTTLLVVTLPANTATTALIRSDP
jgi:hypothetical protein